MTNKKAPLSTEAKESIKEAVKNDKEVPSGFYAKDKFEYVEKNIFSDVQVKEIADGLANGLIYVFAPHTSRNTQYNVRKKLKLQYPKVRFAQVVGKGNNQDALYPLSDSPKLASQAPTATQQKA